MRVVLLVFAKAPVPGRVKTRLRRAWGAQGACRWYRRLLAATVETAVAADAAAVELWCAPDRAHPVLRRLAARHALPLHAQPPGDLGARMLHAARLVLRRADAVIIIGADCTPLTAGQLRDAVAALAGGRDLVLTPAEDGGYVLIGMRRSVAMLFRGVDWGTDRVLRQTRTRIRRCRLRATELPASWDVDRPADVRRLLREGRLRRWGRG
ncbi:MAG: TIGR04282 family arsenosugar biosynthesis glycosyltransferase [Aquisalimonadaceae bacterium]